MKTRLEVLCFLGALAGVLELELLEQLVTREYYLPRARA